ncbi:ABC transporter ATP-binding protein [Ectothiorhodospira haloalkaliphila]|uniref:ABC transporter ATP-binding protein n=1 Tax=Ectothiorhodospira haloalkaliphila TaxID=421628 RepID=UPI000A90A314|nr:ABC transporter ATP-binding protein [Ectothiorhodospira haloalkaliphila]
MTELGKAYKRYPHRWARLLDWLDPFSHQRHDLHWVLRDLNFVVEPGEAVGVIGVNGAGKSTLLKMIAGTTRPTTGSIHIGGRVAALLELGMGFHKDFTGRQNAYMAGQLLGLTARELDALMPSIEAFADLGDYMDQPLRVYSSGMQMRLAFSVATARRPDVLIIDEALSVGDQYFQHKSFDHIRGLAEQGTTLLLVSHDKQAIQSLCDRAILLDNGAIAMEGEPEAVMDYYNAKLAADQNQVIDQNMTGDGKIQTRSGTGEATVRDICLCDESGHVLKVVHVGQRVTLSITVDTLTDLPRLVLGYGIKDRLGQVVFGINTHHTQQVLEHVKAGSQCQFEITFEANLGPGTYSVQTALTSADTHLNNNYEWCDRALLFTVINKDKPDFSGVSWMNARIVIEKT